MLRKIPFIAPMAPTLAKTAPAGPEWIHEVKFDGFRVQVHIEGDAIAIYSRNGYDLTRRFRQLNSAIAGIPARTAIIDCELVACDASGQPCFRSLMSAGKADTVCLWCFDLLAINGERLTEKPLALRRGVLNDLINAGDDHSVQFSCDFPDPLKLLEAANRMGLEGIVSKRKESAYRSGPTRDWLKIKTAAWRAANRDRWDMFEKR